MLKTFCIPIVEDEELLALDLEMTVAAQGGRIAGVCSTLSDAMRMAEEADFDAAILDVDLGSETVFRAAEILRARNIPFVFHTGGSGESKARARFPDAPVCPKPCDSDLLVRMLVAAINSVDKSAA